MLFVIEWVLEGGPNGSLRMSENYIGMEDFPRKKLMELIENPENKFSFHFKAFMTGKIGNVERLFYRYCREFEGVKGTSCDIDIVQFLEKSGCLEVIDYEEDGRIKKTDLVGALMKNFGINEHKARKLIDWAIEDLRLVQVVDGNTKWIGVREVEE